MRIDGARSRVLIHSTCESLEEVKFILEHAVIMLAPVVPLQALELLVYFFGLKELSHSVLLFCRTVSNVYCRYTLLHIVYS